MEIIGKVLFMGLILAIAGAVLTMLSFIGKMINPKFRNNFFDYKKLCKEFKTTGKVELLNGFIQKNYSKQNKYNFYYENDNRIKDDELYDSKYDELRKNYYKIFDTIDHYYLKYFFKSALNKHSNDSYVKFLKKEFSELESKQETEKYHITEQKILKSKERFVSHILKDNIEDKEYLSNLLQNIRLKIK